MGHLAAKLTPLKLTTQELNSVLDTIRDRLLSVSRPSRIILFGSAANGQMNEASDFDLAVVFDDSAQVRIEQRNILRANLFRDLSVDLLFFYDTELAEKAKVGGVCWEIERTGKVLYDKRAKV